MDDTSTNHEESLSILSFDDQQEASNISVHLIESKHWVVKNPDKKWTLHIYKDVRYPETNVLWNWKIDGSYFDSDVFAARYLKKLIREKNTGIRIIKHAKLHVPDICGIAGTACRNPNACNSMLCLDCPVAEEYFAKKDGVTLRYVPKEDIQMEYIKKVMCPNGCSGHFSTTGHVMQSWEVDQFGNFIAVLEDCIQVTADVDFENLWTCSVCGESGAVFNVPRDIANYTKRTEKFLIANDERGCTRLIGPNDCGKFEVVIAIINTHGDKETARNTFEQMYPNIKGKWS